MQNIFVFLNTPLLSRTVRTCRPTSMKMQKRELQTPVSQKVNASVGKICLNKCSQHLKLNKNLVKFKKSLYQNTTTNKTQLRITESFYSILINARTFFSPS
jgi:hypothetical protein